MRAGRAARNGDTVRGCAVLLILRRFSLDRSDRRSTRRAWEWTPHFSFRVPFRAVRRRSGRAGPAFSSPRAGLRTSRRESRPPFAFARKAIEADAIVFCRTQARSGAFRSGLSMALLRRAVPRKAVDRFPSSDRNQVASPTSIALSNERRVEVGA